MPVSLTASFCFTLTVCITRWFVRFMKRASLVCVAPTKHLAGGGGERNTLQTERITLHMPPKERPLPCFYLLDLLKKLENIPTLLVLII